MVFDETYAAQDTTCLLQVHWDGDGVVTNARLYESHAEAAALAYFGLSAVQTYVAPQLVTPFHLGDRLPASLGQRFVVISRRRLLISAAVAAREQQQELLNSKHAAKALVTRLAAGKRPQGDGHDKGPAA